MEPENSVVLESCGEDSMLIQTVKTIVTQSNQNEMENEGFFLVTNVQDDQQRHMGVVTQQPCADDQTEDRVLWSDLCRVCANVNDHLIPIFEGEGIEHELCNKIHKYLPIHVSESDTLPLQLCYHCAATLLAWHELTEGCLSAERKLLEIHESLHTKQQYVQPPTSEERLHEPPQPIPVLTNSVESIPVAESVELKDDGNGTLPINNSDRFGEQRKKSFAAYCSSHSATLCTQSITQSNPKNVNFETMELDSTARSKEENEELNPETDSCGSENVGISNSANVNSIHSSKPTADEPKSELHNSPTETVTSTKRNDKKFHTCITCQRVYKREYNLLRHATKCKKLASKERDPLDTNDIDAPSLIDNPNDAMHTETVSTEKTESVCSDAAGDEELDAWEEFSRPRRKSLSSYPCVYCDYTTKRKKLLKLHVVESHPEYAEKKRKKLRCMDKEAVSRARMEVDGKVYYHCNECGKNLYSPYTFSWHIRIHTGERPFTCHLCGKQFRVNQGLARHLRETHAGIKNFPCDLCGRMFSTKRNAEDHRRIHTGERPYVCNVCGKTFKQKASLFVHNRTHSDVFPFKCSYCEQSFRTRPPLMVHITKHTGEKPHACDICGRCFRIKYELKRHRLIHFDEKPWQCTGCNLSFRQKRYLVNHMKLTHNESSMLP